MRRQMTSTSATLYPRTEVAGKHGCVATVLPRLPCPFQWLQMTILYSIYQFLLKSKNRSDTFPELSLPFQFTGPPPLPNLPGTTWTEHSVAMWGLLPVWGPVLFYDSRHAQLWLFYSESRKEMAPGGECADE